MKYVEYTLKYCWSDFENSYDSKKSTSVHQGQKSAIVLRITVLKNEDFSG